MKQAIHFPDRAFAAALCLFVTVLSAPTEIAAQETGTRIGSTVNAGGDPRLVMRKIANCIVEQRPKIAAKWLNLIPGTPEESRFTTVNEGEMSLCMETGDRHLVTVGELTYDLGEMRLFLGAAAGRVAAERAVAGRTFAADTPAWFEAPLAAMGAKPTFDARNIVQQDFGHCVVISNWDAARDLLRSTPGSLSEAGAIKALVPFLGPCISAGQKVDLTKSAVRQSIAEPFYHLATVPVASGANR